MAMTSEAAKKHGHHKNLGKHSEPLDPIRAFWQRVNKQGDNCCDCWLWVGAQSDDGYGRVNAQRNSERAHRFSYKLHFGDPGDLGVLHHCDTPLCVRPEHLFLGTNADNNQDKAQKGRAPKGDAHWSRLNPGKVARGSKKSTLSEADVLAIRREYVPRKNVAELGKRYGIKPKNIARIAKGQRWSWL